MRKDDVVNLFLNKCRELGGTPKIENSPHSPLLGCQLSSLKNGMELSRFAEKIEVPKDTTVIIFFITGIEKTETCDIDFLHVEKKYEGGRSSHISISLNFPRVIPENMYEPLDKEVRGIVEKELGNLRRKAIASSSVYSPGKANLSINTEDELEDEEIDKILDCVKLIEKRIKEVSGDTKRISEKIFLNI